MGEVIDMRKFERLPERYRQRATQIAVRVSEISALMTPCSSEAIGREVVRMFRQFIEQPGKDVAEMAEGYRSACRDLPEWAISEAVNDYIDGKVEGHTGRFMPICAEFAKHARSILLPFLAERSSLRNEAEKLIERAEDDHRRHLLEMERHDPAVRAHVAAMVEKVTAGAPKSQRLTHGALTPERQSRLDQYRRPRQFISKISSTKIGKS